MDERAVRSPCRHGQLVEDRRTDVDRPPEPRVMLGCRGDQDRTRHLLEVAASDRRVGIVRGDDLALFRELQATINGARGLPEDRPVGRPAASPDRTAAPVEERQLDAPRPGHRGELALRPVEHPRRREESRLLVRIGVAEHHLLSIAPRGQRRAVGRIVEERCEDRTCGIKRRARLEQRHDIEDGHGGRVTVVAGVAGRGDPRELEDVCDIRRASGEAHDVPMARFDPEARLGVGDRPERGEDLPDRHPRRDLGVFRKSIADRRERGRVDRGVLAYLELGQMESERADLPTQFGDLTPGDSVQTLGHERIRDLGQLGLKVGRDRVAARPWRGLADERCSRPAEPLRDEPESLSVRLVRESAAKLAVGLRKVLGIAREPGRQGTRNVLAGRSRGDGLHETGRDRFVAVQHVVSLDPERSEGDVGGHSGVSVAVPADPATGSQEWTDAWRPRPRSAAVRSRPTRTALRTVQRTVERPI